MSETCETVKIADENAPGGHVVINAEDFDPDNHTLIESDEKPKAKAAPAKPSKKEAK